MLSKECWMITMRSNCSSHSVHKLSSIHSSALDMGSPVGSPLLVQPLFLPQGPRPSPCRPPVGLSHLGKPAQKTTGICSCCRCCFFQGNKCAGANIFTSCMSGLIHAQLVRFCISAATLTELWTNPQYARRQAGQGTLEWPRHAHHI